MVAEGTYTAVVDRIEETEEGELAVVILERNDAAIDDLAVPVTDLRAPARRQDAVLEVVIEGCEPTEITVDEAETQRRSRSVTPSNLPDPGWSASDRQTAPPAFCSVTMGCDGIPPFGGHNVRFTDRPGGGHDRAHRGTDRRAGGPHPPPQ